jgi:hypothetical protein
LAANASASVAFHFDPYPQDHLTYKGKEIVEYQTRRMQTGWEQTLARKEMTAQSGVSQSSWAVV